MPACLGSSGMGGGVRERSYTQLSLFPRQFPRAQNSSALAPANQAGTGSPHGLSPASWRGADQGDYLPNPVTCLGSEPSQVLSFPIHKTTGLGTMTFPISFHSKPL